ncbi:hypothetical protein WJX72_004417 [[Myrmecia] bisecta]|uniref:Helicase MAGATAMA 3 n=1 Tax=[Myrmecia] bisecta TaxID=41462 RepID=A0AAW1PH37_9CHLO
MEDQLLSQLHRILLSWDYWELSAKADEGEGAIDDLRQVPGTFKSVEEYISVFSPLVLEECGALLLRGEEGESMEPHPAVVSQNTKKGDFTILRLSLHPGISRLYHENDMVLISKEDPNTDENLTASSELHVLGFIMGHEGEQSISVRVLLSDDSQAGNAKGTARIKAMRHGLGLANSCWYVMKLCSMSTISREWLALHSAAALSFKDILLTAQPSVEPSLNQQLLVPQAMRESMEMEYNGSQMQAVTSGLNGTAVVLIQGPPGTGKTRTILGLLSIIMHSVPAGSAGLAPVKPVATHQLKLEDCQRLYVTASPWICGRPNPRDAVRPWETGNFSDAFGLLDVAPPRVVGPDSGPKAHALICAPSNSALDEIVIRLLAQGLMNKQGQVYPPSIVRVGLSVHHSVQSVALDTLVEAKLQTSQGTKDNAQRIGRAEMERIRLGILEDANIVCSTLSFAGSGIFARMSRRFDVIIIDEAAQAVEPSTLVPLVNGCKQVYLVGDPVQLPATVISKRAVSFGYDVSLFKRLQSSGYPVQILDVQYRMHPEICVFPSNEFYAGALKTGEGVETSTVRPWHEHQCFGPFAFYDVAGKEMVPAGSSSLVNRVEVEMVLCIYRELVHRYPQLKRTPAVAVISPYKAQVKLLREKFTEALGKEGAKMVDINTIDGFQGREKDVAIFSAVRSRVGGSIGFVADERRINVGLTRARSALIVIGNARALQRDQRWGNLVRHASLHKCLYRPVKPFSEYLAKVVDGQLGPAQPNSEDLKAQEEFVAQAEPGVYDDEDACSDYEELAPGVVPHAAPVPDTRERGAASKAQAAAGTAGKRKARR